MPTPPKKFVIKVQNWKKNLKSSESKKNIQGNNKNMTCSTRQYSIPLPLEIIKKKYSNIPIFYVILRYHSYFFIIMGTETHTTSAPPPNVFYVNMGELNRPLTEFLRCTEDPAATTCSMAANWSTETNSAWYPNYVPKSPIDFY